MDVTSIFENPHRTQRDVTVLLNERDLPFKEKLGELYMQRLVRFNSPE